MESKLEQLINNTSFHELTVQEKEYVLEKITEKEYTQFHDVIVASTTVFKSEFHKIKPKNYIKENLSNAFQAKHKRSFLDIKIFDSPLFKSFFLKPALAFGLITIFFYILIPKQIVPVEIAQIEQPNSKINKEIVKVNTVTSAVKIKSANQIIKPIYKKIKFPISELSENDFLTGTESNISENEQICLNTDVKININDDYFISIEEFVSFTTNQTPEFESQQLTINPEDLK